MMDDTLPQPECQYSTQKFLDTFDRGLAKRQSKGKYQVSLIDYFLFFFYFFQVMQLIHKSCEELFRKI